MVVVLDLSIIPIYFLLLEDGSLDDSGDVWNAKDITLRVAAFNMSYSHYD